MSSGSSSAVGSSRIITSNLELGEQAPKTGRVQVLPPSEYDNVCLLTLEKFQDLAKRDELVVTSCGHKFSSVEIIETLTGNPTCPDCGTIALPSDVSIVKLVGETLPASRPSATSAASSAVAPAASGSSSSKAKKLSTFNRIPQDIHIMIAEGLVQSSHDGPLDQLKNYLAAFDKNDKGQIWNAIIRKYPVVVTQLLRNNQYNLDLLPESIRAQFSDVRVQQAVKSIHLNVRSDITTAKLDRITRQFPYLTSLDVGGAGTGLNDEGLLTIIRNLPNLESINLSNADGVTNASVSALLPLTKIKYIKVYGCRISHDLKVSLQATFGAAHVEL